MLRLLIIFLFSFVCVDAVEIHAFLVIDNHAERIGEAMEVNLSRWERELDKIERYTDIGVQRYIYKDDTADFRFVDDLKALDVDPDDVILFYWSGHGFRSSRTSIEENPWPSFCFHRDDDRMVDFKELTDYLTGKGARLVISIAETCNRQIPFFIAPPKVQLKAKGTPLLNRLCQNYADLFLTPSGVVMVASSHPGEFSHLFIRSGSIFTASFLESLKEEVYIQEEASWEAIMLRTTELVIERNHGDQQVPLFEIYE